MPIRKKVKRRFKKRRFYKKKTSEKPNVTLIKNPSNGGFPKSMFTRLKYVWNGSLNPGVAGANSTQLFRCNSMYDPDYTGVGNQPRGFDQWMDIYNHYYVKRSKIIVTFHNGDNQFEVNCGIALRDDASTEPVALEYQEQDSVHAMLGRVGSSHNHKTLTKYYNFSKSNYVPYTQEQNKGTATSNPTELQFFHLWCGSPWGQDSANAYVTATIYYDVLFTELADILQS